MFGGRRSSASHGQGTSNFPMGNSVPMPSGGFTPSVNNKSLENVTNDIPSVLVKPSSHNSVNSVEQPLNRFMLNDFVFAIRKTSYAPSMQSRFGKFGEQETPIVTIQMANKLLRQQAEMFAEECSVTDSGNWKDGTGDFDNSEEKHWWQCPEAVAEWCVPFGAVLNKMQAPTLGGGGGNAARDREMVNVVVSRRANVKNNFFSVMNAATTCERYSAQSTNLVAVQYSMESCEVRISASNVTRYIPVVMISMMLVDDPSVLRAPSSNDEINMRTLKEGRAHCPAESIRVSTVCGQDKPRIHPESCYDKFLKNPLGNYEHRVVIPIGRVLHSPPRSPTAHEALTSCHSKIVYDALKPIEIELGCP